MSAALRDDLFADQNAWVSRQVVTFMVDNQVFATPIGTVREIRGWQSTTPLPNAEPGVVGVLNLRGAIIPIYDLRRCLGLQPHERPSTSVTIVIDTGEKLVGILADSVSDILDVAPEEMRDPPLRSVGETRPLIVKFIVKGETVIALLDLSVVVS